MDFKLPKGDSIRILAPFADMLNHSIEAERCHSYDPSSGNLFILAGKNYDIGDQVRLFSFPALLTDTLTYEFVLDIHQLRTCSKQSTVTSVWVCHT